MRRNASSGQRVASLGGRLVCAVALIGLAPAARANTVVFATGAQMLSGFAENAQATFDINNTTHSITVHLLNLQFNPTDVKQAIGSIRFTISGAGSPVPTSSTPAASDARFDIESGTGRPFNVSDETSTVWRTTASSQSGGWQMQLCTVCTAASTDGLILGGPTATINGIYSNANTTLTAGTTAQWILGSGLNYTGSGSSNRLSGHDSTPDFTITFPTATNLSTVVITNVIFGFGTSANYGSGFITVPVETPEPDSLILFGTGIALIGLAVGTRRLRRS